MSPSPPADPRHRDRTAVERICSGHFTAGIEVGHLRSGGRIRLSAPPRFLARERVAIAATPPGERPVS